MLQSTATARPAAPHADALAALEQRVAAHPIWTCELLRRCELGHLSKADYAYVFSQYFRYSRDFTRYLAAVMANCPSDYFRSRLAENLWEEGGMREPADRHAEIFRDFLRRGLDVDVVAIQFDAFSEHFAARYLAECMQRSPVSASAFLALGTEGIVARMYGMFHHGLRQAGLGDDVLKFFTIHMACDDAHAATLSELLCSYSDLPGWYDEAAAGVDAALDLRLRFFDDLYLALEQRRVQGILRRIQARESLAGEPDPRSAVFARSERGDPLYDNQVERLNIEFAVERVPFTPEVLDPRLVRIPPHRRNELHKHAHETIFVVVEGTGRVLVGETWFEVGTGDLAFVPRWAMHQTENTGDTPMLLLAITDYGLTGKAFVGNYASTARMKRPG